MKALTRMFTRGPLAAVVMAALLLGAMMADATAQQTLKPAHHAAVVKLDPAQGHITLNNAVTIDADGRLQLRLSELFVIERMTINGVHHAPNRQGNILFVDVGTQGTHTIGIEARANLSTKDARRRPPFLGPEGGFLGLDWLGNPVGQPATYRIEVQTPLPQIPIMPGRLESETRTDGLYKAVFTGDVPNDPPPLITGPFTVHARDVNGVRLASYFHPELDGQAESYLDAAARYVAHYADKIGPYPHPGFAMVSGPLPVGIGLPGMTYMGRRVLALPFIKATSLPHEVLHNWWGNGVFVNYAKGNWAEGLTTYQADHAQAAGRDGDGGAAKRLEWLRNYAALDDADDRPVTAFTAKSHDASQVVGYGKVAFVFHMLKVRLGADTFDAAIRRFFEDNLWRYASWADVRQAFDAEDDAALDAFFDAWLERPGAPRLHLDGAAHDGNAVTFTLSQTQDGEPFPVTVPVVIETASGPQHLMADMTERRHTFRFTAPDTPQAVHVDPDFDVFRRLAPTEAPPIFRDVTLKGDTRLIVPGGNGDIVARAEALATRLLEGPVQMADPTGELPDGPLIVAGLEGDVTAFMRRHAITPPAAVPNGGTARAFVVRPDGNGGDPRAVLLAMARDAEALDALARVLPHYRRRSYVVMQDGEVAHKGTISADTGPLTVRLDGGG